MIDGHLLRYRPAHRQPDRGAGAGDHHLPDRDRTRGDAGRNLAPQSRTTVSADANTQLGATAFSSTVSSPLGIPIAVERTMRWDADRLRHAHGEGGGALARDWFFAEGAQGFYDTFFLLTNPTPAANVANVRFFLENGTQVTRSYNLTPQSR
jgi:hypothetical protein